MNLHKAYPRASAVAVVSILLFALSGCATFDQVSQTRRAIEQSKFELTAVDARVKVDLPRLQNNILVPGRVDIGFRLGFRVDNRFGQDLPLNRIDIKLYADNDLVATGTTRKRIVLSHVRPTRLSAFVNVEPAAATNNLVKRLKGKHIRYQVDAVFYFNVNQFEIPISMTLAKKSA
ncbi:MAG: LEA type 2 family protein [Acidiferrobacterales bacterium]